MGTKKVIVGISGASGAIYGWRLLERLRAHGAVEIHLILTRSGEKTLFLETGKTIADLKTLSDFFFSLEGISCPLASGSFSTHPIVVGARIFFYTNPTKPLRPLSPFRFFLIPWRTFPAAGLADLIPATRW